MGKAVYPCLYGLRDCCEALTLLMRPVPVPVPSLAEPKTDEEKVFRKFFDTWIRYLVESGIFTADPQRVAYAMRSICEICPHRLQKLKEVEVPAAPTPVPVRFAERPQAGTGHA
jgi:hypothetical protein